MSLSQKKEWFFSTVGKFRSCRDSFFKWILNLKKKYLESIKNVIKSRHSDMFVYTLGNLQVVEASFERKQE